MNRLKRLMAAMLKKMDLHMPNSLSEHLQIFRILKGDNTRLPEMMIQ